MKVLMVLTSHDQLGNTGRKTGFWLEELAAPYYVFKNAGAQITLASPKGGRPPLDPKSNEPNFQTDITRRIEKDTTAEDQLSKTLRLETVMQEDTVSDGQLITGQNPASSGPAAQVLIKALNQKS